MLYKYGCAVGGIKGTSKDHQCILLFSDSSPKLYLYSYNAIYIPENLLANRTFDTSYCSISA